MEQIHPVTPEPAHIAPPRLHDPASSVASDDPEDDFEDEGYEHDREEREHLRASERWLERHEP